MGSVDVGGGELKYGKAKFPLSHRIAICYRHRHDLRNKLLY